MEKLTKASSVSDHAFRVSYLRRSRELYRRFLESKPWIGGLYTSFFELKPGLTIVDVGCGTGDFSRYLAKLSGGKATVLGIDANEKSVQAAIIDSRRGGLSGSTSFKKGDVYKLPLADGYADVTCCRTLLMHLPDPLKAISEMARITRHGGSVIAVEPGRTSSFYDPDDEKYSKLTEDAYNAWLAGIKKIEGKDFRIGEKLPGMFRDAGLTNVRAEIHADAWLYSDPRRKLVDIRESLRFDRSILEERKAADRKYLIAGGRTNRWVTDYYQRLEREMDEKIHALDDELRNNASFYTGGFTLVAGTKR